MAAPAPATTATTVAPPTTGPDPGVAACKATAKHQAARKATDAPPTLEQRRASWQRYQASHYPSLRKAGEQLERAWTTGAVSDQLAAAMNLVVACYAYGVDIPTG